MDCLRVARRAGAGTVRCIYRRSEAEAPARIEEIRHAKEEGIEFFFLHAPVEILINGNGDVRGIRVQKMELGEPDERGRRRPIALDEFVELECDTIIYALGTKPNPIIGQSAPGLALNKWGNIVANEDTQSTNVPGVFAGGDIVTGGATVILAMSAGRRAAKGIAAWLQNGKVKWPMTREDAEAFVPGEPVVQAGAHGTALCPKCRQPVEGPEAYICCAGATLEWRCEECAKVSEGFAFPYGMCPYCGGKLNALERPGITGESGIQAIRVAFEIELGGLEFYSRASSQCGDPQLSDLFGKLAGMERDHMATLSRRYHVEIPGPSDDFRADLAAVRAGVDGRIDDPATLFKADIAFEKRAVTFFSERARTVVEGSVEHELYRELAAEEVEHVAILETEFARWSAGREGLL
jgi:hypothetical protein